MLKRHKNILLEFVTKIYDCDFYNLDNENKSMILSLCGVGGPQLRKRILATNRAKPFPYTLGAQPF